MMKILFKNLVNRKIAAFYFILTGICTALQSNAQNPLASAQQFNIFTEGNFTIGSGDVEGAIAVGGNFLITGNAHRTSNNATGGQGFVTIGGFKYAMVVAGDVQSQSFGMQFKIDGKAGATDDHYVRTNATNLSATLASGGIDIAKTSDLTNKFIRVNNTVQAVNTIQNATPLVDFTSAFNDLRTQSTRLSALANNISQNLSGGQLTINLNNTSQNVWNVTGNDLNSYSQINLTGNLPAAGRPFIINVNTAAVWYSWNNLKFNIVGESDVFVETNRAPYILFNFYNTTNLNIAQPNPIFGSILAPNTNITQNASGNIAGQVIAKTYTKPQVGEFHIAKFNANVISGVLPVDLISFNASMQNSFANLNWTSANENNLSRYEVERSTNGVNYTMVNTVVPATSVMPNKNYSVNDAIAGLAASKIYYRLKIIDKDGGFKYSTVVIVRLNGIKIAAVYPNPFADKIQVELESKNKETALVKILDLHGKTVSLKQYPVEAGGNLFSVTNLGKLPKANYILEISTATEKLVLQIKN